MAMYIPVRPHWNPRGEVVNYVSRGRLCARGWPTAYRDANTPKQREQRGKMAQACDVLPFIKSLLAEGYSAVHKRNGRRVGAYHTAVSVALREWFAATPEGPRLDTAKIRLTDGVSRLPAELTAAREGNKLEIAWRPTTRWRGAKLLVAVRRAKSQEWACAKVAVADGSALASFALPPQWAKGTVEIWVAFVGNGDRVKTQTMHLALPPSATLTPPSPSKPRGRTCENCLELARKGSRAAKSRRARYGRKMPSNACQFKLPGRCCIVSKCSSGSTP